MPSAAMTELFYVFIMPRHRAFCWFLSLLVLTACSSEPVKPQTKPPTFPAQSSKKTDSNAATSYALADVQALQHLQNAADYLRSGNNQAVLKELDVLNYANLPSEQRSQFNLLDAQVALSNGDAERALSKMANIRPKLLNDADKISYYQSLAFAYALTGNVLQSVTARIRLGNILADPQQQQDNIISILDTLSTLSLDALNVQPNSLDDLNGWMALAKIFKQRDQPGIDLNSQLLQWRQLYPRHPAKPEYLQNYLANRQTESPTTTSETSNSSLQSNANIAVLLPASGTYAQAGKVIKDGLQTAQRLASSIATQTPLKFYDTEQGDIISLYQQAVADGATLVIGPLIKEQIQALAKTPTLSVPVLALNHVEDVYKTNLYQFGLSPIDEANELAAKAWQDGRQSALLLMPNTSLGQRISQYLATAWQSKGGVIAGIQSYDPKQHDIADILKALLSSSSDLSKPAQTVFLSATPEVGREFAVQLKYYQGSNLAVYAMPNIYSGQINPVQDAELGKINFCDMPWFFPDYYNGALSQSALQTHWQNLTDAQIRLLALGLDAYNLVNHLAELSSKSFAGATGQLALVEENRISRKLVCAQFKAGLPQATGYVQ
jgi:outer membrane PBP1 activator LpoA protein